MYVTIHNDISTSLETARMKNTDILLEVKSTIFKTPEKERP